MLKSSLTIWQHNLLLSSFHSSMRCDCKRDKLVEFNVIHHDHTFVLDLNLRKKRYNQMNKNKIIILLIYQIYYKR